MIQGFYIELLLNSYFFQYLDNLLLLKVFNYLISYYIN